MCDQRSTVVSYLDSRKWRRSRNRDVEPGMQCTKCRVQRQQRRGSQEGRIPAASPTPRMIAAGDQAPPAGALARPYIPATSFQWAPRACNSWSLFAHGPFISLPDSSSVRFLPRIVEQRDCRKTRKPRSPRISRIAMMEMPSSAGGHDSRAPSVIDRPGQSYCFARGPWDRRQPHNSVRRLLEGKSVFAIQSALWELSLQSWGVFFWR